MTYGLDVGSEDDALISIFGEALDRIVEEGAPGLCTIDLFPIRKHAAERLSMIHYLIKHFSQACTILVPWSRFQETP